MKKQPSFLKKAACLMAALLMFATSAFATPTALTTQILYINGNVNAPITAGTLTLTFTACDNVNGNSFISTGHEVLIVQNTAGGAGTFTVNSVADQFNRLDTSLTAYSVAAGAFAIVQMKNTTGWLQSSPSQSITLACSAATMKFAVVQYN